MGEVVVKTIEPGLATVYHGIDNAIPQEDHLSGLVVRFQRCKGLKQWRFQLHAPGSPLNDKYVAVANTRQEAAEQGVEFERAVREASQVIHLAAVSVHDLWKDFLLHVEMMREQVERDRATGYTFQLSRYYDQEFGKVSYLMDKLESLGVDKRYLNRIAFDGYEDWQQ